MKKWMMISLVLVLALALMTGCTNGEGGADGATDTPSTSSSDVPDNVGAVVAKVNGAEIYETEFDFYFGGYAQNYCEQYGSYMAMMGFDLATEEGMHNFLAAVEESSWQMIIDAEMLRQMAEQDYGLTYADEALKDVIPWGNFQSIRLNSLYQQMFPLVSNEMKDTSDESLRAIYDADPTQYDSRQTSHILFKFELDEETGEPIESSIQPALEKALAALERLNNGEDFATLAEELSEDTSAANGGKIDSYLNVHSNLVGEGSSFVPEYTAAAFALQNIGDYTHEPVRSQYGYHIIKLDDIHDTFEDSRDAILATQPDPDQSLVQEEIWARISEKTEAAEIERIRPYEYMEDPATVTEDETTDDGTADDGTATDDDGITSDDAAADDTATPDGTTTDGSDVPADE